MRGSVGCRCGGFGAVGGCWCGLGGRGGCWVLLVICFFFVRGFVGVTVQDYGQTRSGGGYDRMDAASLRGDPVGEGSDAFAGMVCDSSG